MTDKPAAGHTEPRQCDGSDDPRKRCGHHHATGLSNGFGGYECCCGDTWRGAPDECLSGAKTGQPVALRDRVYALIGYLTDECDPANLDACTDAVIPAIRAPVLAEHPRDDSNPHGPWCPTCTTPWPCRTARAARGDQ